MNTIIDEKSLERGLAQLLRANPQLVPVAEYAGTPPLRLQEGGFARGGWGRMAG